MKEFFSFFNRPTLKVLEDLIGMILTRKSSDGITSGIIVEAEAYRGEDDPASFAFRGRTKKSESLYGPPGRAFVYLTYGVHHMLNVVTERENFPAAVLIRAVEPKVGISLMKKRRNTEEILNLCSGPGKLCQAFGIDLSLNGISLSSAGSSLYLQGRAKSEKNLIWKARVGIREGKDRLWRAYLKDNPFISVR